MPKDQVMEEQRQQFIKTIIHLGRAQYVPELQGALRSMEERVHREREKLLDNPQMTPEQIRAEKECLQARLQVIDQKEKEDLTGPDGKEFQGIERRRARFIAQRARAAAYGEFARILPIGSKERKEAMAQKEQQEISANKQLKRFKISQMENPVEKKREESTFSRHSKYDFLRKILRKENPLSHEDSTWEQDGHKMVNVGRAFFGGTKPMYIFEDKNAPIKDRDGNITGYKQYLFKEAVNCVGVDKPEGALVTEAASKLQEKICGLYSIPAFSATENGRVLGSFQEKIDINKRDNAVDLFSWQAKTQNGEQVELPDQVKNEILREHALDWLLCNFDTKGENFLHRAEDGHICSFDKEASFGKLFDPGAQHMSREYKPHANDTLYNTIFSEYAAGRIKLDLNSSLEHVKKVEAMTKEEYLGLFDKMLEQKYGRTSPKNTKRKEVEAAILSRKENLREEYKTFYKDLIRQRRKSLGDLGREDDTVNLLNEAGEFRFPDEKQNQKVQAREREKDYYMKLIGDIMRCKTNKDGKKISNRERFYVLGRAYGDAKKNGVAKRFPEIGVAVLENMDKIRIHNSSIMSLASRGMEKDYVWQQQIIDSIRCDLNKKPLLKGQKIKEQMDMTKLKKTAVSQNSGAGKVKKTEVKKAKGKAFRIENYGHSIGL